MADDIQWVYDLNFKELHDKIVEMCSASGDAITPLRANRWNRIQRMQWIIENIGKES